MYIVSAFQGRPRAGKNRAPLRTRVALFAGCAVCLVHLQARAADPPAQDPRDAMIQQLLKRVEALESEMKEQRIGGLIPKHSPPLSTSPVLPPPDLPEVAAHDRFPQLEFHGFGEISYGANDRNGRDNSFALGQTDFFLTSRLSDTVDILAEMVVEAGTDNRLEFQLERLQFNYRPRDYFNISAGRYHTAIGYYSTAYHHGTWFQTATGRPFIFAFEDVGGILPIHSVGVSATGQIPTASLGLHYVVEVGNGRHYSNGEEEPQPVLNVVDDNDYKSVNLALYARPDWAPGWQFGFSAYHDKVTPAGLPRIDQSIVAAYAVWQKPRFEWLNEVLWFRHKPVDGTATYSLAAYTQMSRQWGAWRPYLRYQYLYAQQDDLIFSTFGRPGYGEAGLTHGPSIGLRYDFSDLAALKFQFDHYWQGGRASVNQFTAQVGYTF